MSEYQYYEFLAVDRPLDDDEQADGRSLSTDASFDRVPSSLLLHHLEAAPVGTTVK